jgi:Holliday junction resolvase RusA-like endonuclease
MTVIRLPFPPTLNNLFINAGKRRIKSEGYKAWLFEAGWTLKAQRPTPIHGPYILTLTLLAPDRQQRDLDNLCKATSDLLVEHGVIDADHLAKRIILEWSDAAPIFPGAVTVTVEPAEPQALAVAA